MASQQELQGSWNQIKCQLKERWGQLTDGDLAAAEADLGHLVEIVQKKVGAARRDVESFLDQCVTQGSVAARHLSETAQDYARGAADCVSNGYDELSNRIQRGYAETQQLVRRSPAESVAVAFGAGILTGIVAALLLRSPR